MRAFAIILPNLELDAVGIGWLLFAAVFLARKKLPRVPDLARNQFSILGLLLQIVGYLVVRLGFRAPGVWFLPLGTIGEVGSAIVAFGIMAASIYLSYAAVQILGKQWSLAARLVQGHELVTGGPYGWVRHPIYTSMFGMLIGTAIAMSQWPELLIGAVVFLSGTALRIRAEEQLLVDAFGDEYREYARKVPALIPGRSWNHQTPFRIEKS